jgi:hypothetical protein
MAERGNERVLLGHEVAGERAILQRPHTKKVSPTGYLCKYYWFVITIKISLTEEWYTRFIPQLPVRALHILFKSTCNTIAPKRKEASNFS